MRLNVYFTMNLSYVNLIIRPVKESRIYTHTNTHIGIFTERRPVCNLLSLKIPISPSQFIFILSKA